MNVRHYEERVHPIEPLLYHCSTLEDVHYLRQHPEHLRTMLGVRVDSEAVLDVSDPSLDDPPNLTLQELHFLVQKCLQLEMAEQRVNTRRALNK